MVINTISELWSPKRKATYTFETFFLDRKALNTADGLVLGGLWTCPYGILIAGIWTSLAEKVADMAEKLA